MEPDDYPEIPCEPPNNADIGDSWICPKCARKFHYIYITLEPEGVEAECWFTNEIR